MTVERLVEEVYEELKSRGYKVTKEEVENEVKEWLDIIKNAEKHLEEVEVSINGEKEEVFDLGWSTDNSRLLLSKDKKVLYLGTLDGFIVAAEGLEDIVKWLVLEFAIENFER